MKKVLVLGALLTPVYSVNGVFAAPAPATPKPATPQKAVPATGGALRVPKPAVAKPPVAKAAVKTAPSAAKVAKPVAAPVAFTPLPAAKSNLEKLPNGVNFVTRMDKLAPRVAISLVIRAGAADETPANAGWRRMLVNAMLRGAPKGYESPDAKGVEAAESLSRAAEKVGGTLGATVGDDFVEIYVTGDAESAPELLNFALAFWKTPRLSEDDIKAAREGIQTQVDAGDSDTAAKTQAALRSQLFRDARGELSAYGLPDYGTDTSIANLTDDKLRELHATKLATARVTVAATGEFDAAALREKLESLPSTAASEPATPTFVAPKAGAPGLVVRELPVPSAWIFVSYPLAGNTQNESAALRVMAAALGDSSQARLPARLLHSRVMGSTPPAFSVAAQYIPRRYASELTVYAQTSPQSVDRVKNALLDEMRKLRDVPLSGAELQSAKQYARGSWSVERMGLRERAFQSALSPALGGPIDTSFPASLQKVTSGDVQKAAQKYLKAYAVALVMPSNG